MASSGRPMRANSYRSPPATPPPLFQERQDQPGPGGADGMAEGDGPAVDINPAPVQLAEGLLPAELLAGEAVGGEGPLVGDDLGGEGFVQLDEVNVPEA